MFPIDQSVFSYLRQNRDMLFAYFSLGFLLQLPVTVMRFFLVDRMELGSAMLAQCAAIVAFPWAIKPGTAFLSDNFLSKCIPRNRQVAAAYGFAGLCWLAFLFLPDGSTDSLYLVLFYGFLSSFFMSLADVCQDGLMVRRIHADSSNGNGRLQSFVLASRAFGSLLGSFLSGGLALLFRPFLFIALLHIVGILSGLQLKTLTGQHEDRSGSSRDGGGSSRDGGGSSRDGGGSSRDGGDGGRRRVHGNTCRESCTEFCKALCWDERLLFVGVLFLLAMPLSDFAILQYWFQKTKGVQPFSFAFADALAYIAMILGSLTFNAYFRKTDWRVVVMLSQCVSFVFIATNMLLVNDYLTVQPESYLFVRAGIASFFGHIGFMPLAVKAADLVPEGFESTFYSLYMSNLNFGAVVSEELSGLTTKVLGIDTSTNNSVYFYFFVIVSNLISLFVFHQVYKND